MATDSMASPQSTDSLDERVSEAYSAADLDSLSDGEARKTTEGESNSAEPTDPHTEAVDGPGGTGDGHSVPPSDTNSTSLAEGVTGADGQVTCVKSVSGKGPVLSGDCPPTPQLEGTDQTEEGEVKEGSQEEAAPPSVHAVETPEEVDSEQQSTNSSEPVEQAEGHAYEKEGDLTERGHTLMNASNPQEVSGVTEDPSDETEQEPLDAPDSPVFLSDGGVDAGDLSVDHQPLDFSLAREQWVRRDSTSGKAPTPSGSRRSSVCRPLDLPTALTSQLPLAEEAPIEADAAIAAGDQQGEEQPHSPSVLKENQEGQQVCEETPPMETVARKLANQVAESSGASPVVLKEPLREAGAEGEGEGERESGQTNGEQTAASTHTAEAQEEGRAEGVDGRCTETAQLKGGANAAGPLKACRMEDPYDDNQSDSGVSADFSAEVSTRTPLSNSPEPCKPPANETPIEREIRLAAEREQSLRQARGLSLSDKEQEFVDIPIRRPILSQTLPPAKTVKDKGKERQFAGKKMQREISQETQREQDLVQLGRVQGFYEKGTVRQLRERKLLFEAFQQPQEMPTNAGASQRTASVSASDLSTLEALGDESSASSTCGSERRHSLELLSPRQSHAPATCGPGLSEGTSSQIIIMEGHHISQMPLSYPEWTPHTSPGHLTEEQAVTVVDAGTVAAAPSPPYVKTEQEEREGEGEEVNSVMVRENPFFKLRSSMSMRPEVERDIRQAQERERELRKQRTSLYQGSVGAEAGSSPTQNTHNGPAQTCSSAQYSLGKTDLTVTRPQTDTTHREQTEALKSPFGVVRTPRQKTPLVQRWEAGMVNGQED
ncbi:hypothetical protein AALO_G00105150 [Alosa alosa]|uniref:A-kinase anchor protein 2 C-terminal domain-containing protein n=1 Tax=Alosa alosa TaxID=278164 RepID=A0AAV6H139_9TELE|nr:uncharacterized protein misp3 [Alosa alosa]KAG5279011.1 hypothetical protein AALO_G00105150 [Alosa alosa]